MALKICISFSSVCEFLAFREGGFFNGRDAEDFQKFPIHKLLFLTVRNKSSGFLSCTGLEIKLIYREYWKTGPGSADV